MAKSRDNSRFHFPDDSDVEIRSVIPNGSSTAVTIPSEDAEEYGIEPGDQVGVRVTDDGCVEILTDGGK